jgi:hypothetical protein
MELNNMGVNPYLSKEVKEQLYELRVRVLQLFQTQGNFAIALNRPEGFVSSVLCGRRILKPHQKREWAELLKSDLSIFPDITIRRTFPDGTVEIYPQSGGVVPHIKKEKENQS